MQIRRNIINLFLKIYQPKKMGAIEKFIRNYIFYDKFIVAWYKDIFSNPKLEFVSEQGDLESLKVLEFVNNNESDNIIEGSDLTEDMINPDNLNKEKFNKIFEEDIEKTGHEVIRENKGDIEWLKK